LVPLLLPDPDVPMRQPSQAAQSQFIIPTSAYNGSSIRSKRLYDMVRQIRQEKTGTAKQAGPLQMGKLYERIMK